MFKDIELIYVLTQILIVLFPIFVYQLFFNDSNKPYKKGPNIKLTLILLVMVLLTMSFPVRFSEGYIYDFRIVPFIIAFLYGGLIPGLLTLITLLVFRFYVGGEGFYHVLICYSVATVILLYYMNRYDALQMKKKIVVVSSVFWLMTFTLVITYLNTKELNQIPFLLFYYFLSWVCLLMGIYTIENVNQKRTIDLELQRAEKLNVISQLAASVAHEVRNPMTSVRGFLQLLKEDEVITVTQNNYITIAIDELDHAQAIINDYLSLAKPHNEEKTLLNLSNEVKKAIELMTSFSTIFDIDIKSELEENLCIQGNRGEVKQVLINIIKNGIESMDMGGLLYVKLYKAADFVFIEIKDTGKGMTESQLKKIGTPFYTTKEKGTGIGMTITYQLIQSMRGSIRVESKLGKGTTFTITFPIKN
ncbi:ATP-binding protein [Peribacillus psychrosaccharolyticus]|uniref:ATP-binding protein n=1 Tax=Peribacillus psychrosaccharolyticus TaxID=1407 RepID=UPI001F2742BE|nr:ATP-binding protein [Peribacillus psychrosaccharolyticus]MEC2056355.1 ATP-binding protein [Peribacillus psychrosaccharolyticus]MED3743757.1 ATP-binding protein [Peribacillus psychrosaccharolyticus]